MIMCFGTRNKQHPSFMEGKPFLVTKEERDIGVMASNMLKPSA
jgi:hypothetical protein